MMIDLIVIFIILVAGCWVLIQLYDLVKNETIRNLMIAGYGFLAIYLIGNWFIKYTLSQLTFYF